MAPRSVDISDGGSMPVVGLGTWQIGRDEAAEIVQQAAEAGYRHFDCACDYGNEREVGAGLRCVLSSGLCDREDLWITSKLWNTFHAPRHVRPAAERTLADLGLDYLDLYLIHFPIALRYVSFDDRYPPGWFFDLEAEKPVMVPASVPLAETWRAMEDLVRSGLVRHIGVSNFNCSLLRDLLAYAQIRPAVLQVEAHPYLTQEKLLRFCRQEGVLVTGFSPLGAGSYVSLDMARKDDSVLRERVIQSIASEHDKTPAQIVLRWAIQRKTAVIPKTTRVDRLRENLDLFDFELSADEMHKIGNLNRNRRFNDPGVFCERAFNTFFPVFE